VNEEDSVASIKVFNNGHNQNSLNQRDANVAVDMDSNLRELSSKLDVILTTLKNSVDKMVRLEGQFQT
jgi:hypothetical protein